VEDSWPQKEKENSHSRGDIIIEMCSCLIATTTLDEKESWLRLALN